MQNMLLKVVNSLAYERFNSPPIQAPEWMESKDGVY